MTEFASSSEHPGIAPVVPSGRFWAKLHPRVNPTNYHPLFAHSADVAAVLQRLLQPDSVLAARLARSMGLNELPDAVAARLVYLAALHDLGKVNHSFQDQWRARAAPSRGHVRVVLESRDVRALRETLRDVLRPLRLPTADSSELLRTVICHHGRPWDCPTSPSDAIWTDVRFGRDPLAEIRRLAALGREWSGLGEAAEGEVPPLTPGFLHLFAGILTLADWVGSTQIAFPLDPAADDEPGAYWRRAQEQAFRACASIGLTPRTAVAQLSGVPLLERIFPGVFGAERPAHLTDVTPTPLQRHVAEMELPAAGSRVLIESETGSGKTEAALALYARLRAAGQVSGLVFALPTRATASAMHERVARAVAAMYEPGAQPTLALAMGGDQAHAALAEGDESARRLAADEPDTYPDPAERELARWSSGSAKKFFAAEIVIGTIDQLLLGVLAVNHAHLRLAAFSRHLLVVDELHSYDRYMAEALRQLLEVNSANGGVALLMSATLSDRERLRFGGLVASDDDEQSALEIAVGRHYPVVSVCARPGTPWIDTELEQASGAPKPPLGWRLCVEEEGLRQAVRAARAGARVCVLRNTVNDARATVQQLLNDHDACDVLWRPEGSEHVPAYHSRYTIADRRVLDAGVLAAFGRGRAAAESCILVATQVAEQSLDVDFDLMVTDLCPMDVLLQRLGRVWRHRERDASRPDACREVQVWVMEPAGGLEPLLGNPRNGKHGWGTVYRHLGFLELTRREIHERLTATVPADNRQLIEAVYHEEHLSQLRASSAEWEKHFTDEEGEVVSHEMTAKGVVIRFADGYIANADRFRRDTGRIRTRLGDDRVRVALPAPLAGFYDRVASTEAVDLPWERLQKAGVPAVALVDPRAARGGFAEGAFHFELAGFAFRYSPQGWEW